MLRSRLLLITMFVLLGAILVRAQSPESNFSTLRAHFDSPGEHNGSAPLWVWNTKVTHTEIDSMLAGFKKNAFGGVFVHPRPGLVTAYLSDEWFEDYQYTVKRAKELGLDVWIYDENSYPSGFAGGHVPDQMPSSYNQGQMLHLTKVTMLPDTADRSFRCVSLNNGGFSDITDSLTFYKGKSGQYYLFSKAYYGRSAWFGGFSYVDLMVKGVTEKFIDVTMKGYEKSIGGEFGKTVRGIFSDEANIETQGSGNVRWTPDLFTSFQQKWGYDLVPQLPSLYEEVGDWKKVRHNYFETLLELFVDRWSKPFAAYAAQKGLEWTGHYWEHSWPDPDNGPDNMAMYVYPQRPGIDMLFNQFNEVSPGAQFGNVRSVKELGSVANQLGKKRTLSETYGGGGWDLTFKDMLRLGNWEFVLGVNTLNQHLAHMTIGGARKYDYPQSFSYHTPWWPYYGWLNRHFTRLTYAITQGEERNPVLVIEPTTTAWMYFKREHPGDRFREIGAQFQTFVTKLQKSQVEYDLGSEYIIRAKGRVAAGKFIIGERAYTTVVLPPGMENADRATAELLSQFAAAGGKILQFEALQTIDGGQDALAVRLNALPVKVPALTDALIAEHLLAKDLSILPVTAGDPIGGDLYHIRRQLQDGQLLFFSNADMNKPSAFKINIVGKKVLSLNTFTGVISEYPSAVVAGKLTFSCTLAPAGSRLLFVANGPVGTFPRNVATDIAKGHTLPGVMPMKVERPVQNTLMIDFCDVHIGDTVLTDKHVFDAADTVFKHFGFVDGNPWNTSVQFKTNIVDRDHFATGTGFKVQYHFTIGAGVDVKGLEAVAERCGQWSITVNGKAVQPAPGRWWLDKSFGVLPIGALVHSGENTLELSTDRMSIYDEIEPIYILGNFNLASAAKGWTITAPGELKAGSWREQGMPMYGGGVHYVKKLDWTTGPHRAIVQLSDWKGTVAAVRVNDKDAGIIISDPNTLDITRFLRAGTNTVDVEVIGSLKNLLGPHHRSPKPGLASPWHWRLIRQYPAGAAYDTYDYGLMTDFGIVEL